MKKKIKAVVIGSGLAGLTVGAYIAKAGHEVDLFEQYPTIGGVTATIEQDGYRWDLGPMILEKLKPGEAAGDVLADLGLTDKVKLVPGDRDIAFPDFILRRPDSSEGQQWRLEQLRELFPEDSKGLDRYWKLYCQVRKMLTWHYRFQRYRGIKGLWAAIKLLGSALPLIKYRNWDADKLLSDLFVSKEVRAVFAGILADLVVRPSEFIGLGVVPFNPEPAYDSRLSLKLPGGGLDPSFTYVVDGCEKLVEALASVILENGGRIHTSSTVQRIEVKDNKVSGVVLSDGDRYEANRVLVSGSAREASKHLLRDVKLPPKLRNLLDTLPQMESVFMVHLGVKDFDTTKFQRDTLTYYYGTYEMENDIGKVQQGLYHEGKDGFLIYVPSLHSPSMAPPGGHAITLYTIAPNKLADGSWETRREEMADKLVACAEEKMPGLSEHVVTRIIMTPVDFGKRTHMAHHSFGGVSASITTMGIKGAPFRCSIHGLHFIGAQSQSFGAVANVMHGSYRVAKILGCAK